MRDRFQMWVDAVCEQVRFRPDRKSIARELRVHYEDHRQDLLRLNFPPELAESRALDKVHKPWLGWLWEASRVLICTFAILLIYVPDIRYTGGNPLLEQTLSQAVWEPPAYGASHAATSYMDLWLSPGEAVNYRGYLREQDYELPESDGDPVRVSLRLSTEQRDVFHSDLQGLFQYLEVTADGQPLPWGSRDETANRNRSSGYWYGNWKRSGWTRKEAEIVLILDAPPRKVTLSHPWGGWTLTAEWEGDS